MRGIAWSLAWTWGSKLAHVYQCGRSKDCNEINDIHSDVSLRVRKVEVKVGWQGAGMMIMDGDGDDIYDGFVYIPWVVVSLGQRLVTHTLAYLVVERRSRSLPFPVSIPRDLICHLIAWRVEAECLYLRTTTTGRLFASSNDAAVSKQSFIISQA